MMPRINIPWYRVAIKQSVFEDAGQPRPIKFDIDRTKNIPTVPTPEYEWQPAFATSPVYEPALSPAKSPVYEWNPVTVPSPAYEPALSPAKSPVYEPATSPVKNPVYEPATKPATNPAKEPATSSNPLPKPVEIPAPNPILPPLKEKEKSPSPALNPIPSYAQMMNAQKDAQRKMINDKAYRELVQYDMLMERNLAQRRIINKNSKLSANNLTEYQKFVQNQTVTNYNRLSMSKDVMDRQTKAFNQAIEKLEVKLGSAKDIILNYIQNNEISIGTMPYHYKELNKEIAKAGLTGLAVGTIAYVLYQVAKVGVLVL